MLWLRISMILFFFTALAGCGKTTTQIQVIRPPGGPGGDFNFDDSWAITTKRCGNQTIPSGQDEHYQLNTLLIARTYSETQGDSSLCRWGYFWARKIAAFERQGANYQEEATLNGGQAKKQCWRVVNGKPMDPPYFDGTVGSGKDSVDEELSATPNFMVINLRGSKECPNALLHLELARQQD